MGFFHKGFILKMPIDFLIDNGSTGSILSSHKFNKLRTDLEPLLRPFDTFVYDASGNVIPSHGAVDVKIFLGGCDFEQTLIICDIQQDGVIGQNFLLKYAENISYKHGRINTKINEINCWLGDRSSAKCRVIVRKTTTITSLTASWLPIEIPGSENLTKFGYVEANKLSNADLAIIPGIMNMSETEKRISVVNQTENLITLYAKQPVGTCNLYVDKIDTGFYQNDMYSTFQDNKNQIETYENATTHPVPIFHQKGRETHFAMALKMCIPCEPQTCVKMNRIILILLIRKRLVPSVLTQIAAILQCTVPIAFRLTIVIVRYTLKCTVPFSITFTE